jgi:Right handed beta helix region
MRNSARSFFSPQEITMTNRVRLLVWPGLMLAVFLHAPFAHAQTTFATRTWISGTGDDANPCSRTQPCRTFNGAMPKTATGGEIDALDPGGGGTLNITRAMTIDGGTGVGAAVLASNVDGIAVQPGSGAVILRNLKINGAGTGQSGILFKSGTSLLVENCEIYGFSTIGIFVLPSAGTSRIVIANTTIFNNGVGGIQVKPTGGAITLSLRGVLVASNGFGIGADTTGGGTVSVMIDHTTVSNHTGNGLQVAGTGSTMLLSNSTVSQNDVGWNITNPAIASSFKNNVIDQSIHGNVVGTVQPNSYQ